MIDHFFKENRSEKFFIIRMWLWIKCGTLIISKEKMDGADEVYFTFWEMNSSSFDSMDDECLENFDSKDGEHFMFRNSNKMKRFYLRYMFRSWSFNESMCFQADGGLDDESFDKLMSLHPAILRELVKKIYDYTLSEEDEATIVKQSHLLFKKGGSVNCPHKMIALYCTLSDMWDKFGLNYFDLKKMPIYEKNALRKIITIEKQIESQEMKMKDLQNKAKSRGRYR